MHENCRNAGDGGRYTAGAVNSEGKHKTGIYAEQYKREKICREGNISENKAEERRS